MLLNHELHSVVQPDVESGEQILWVGQPNAARMAVKSIGGFLFGVGWTWFTVAFIMGWMSHNSSSQWPGGIWGFGGLAFYLFMTPFLIVGLAMLASPLLSYQQGLRTFYAITNQRILVIETGKSRKVQSYGEGDIGNLERTEQPDGSGDLTFAKQHYKDGDGDLRTRDIKLVGIAQVRTVENIIREVFKKSS
ncbi:MAG: hypothetical protein JO316_01245 [Abitibacteriaceae bacterium]|nr:hypothetical protein [Abditibacteriaceae bacterium]